MGLGRLCPTEPLRLLAIVEEKCLQVELANKKVKKKEEKKKNYHKCLLRAQSTKIN